MSDAEKKSTQDSGNLMKVLKQVRAERLMLDQYFQVLDCLEMLSTNALDYMWSVSNRYMEHEQALMSQLHAVGIEFRYEDSEPEERHDD